MEGQEIHFISFSHFLILNITCLFSYTILDTHYETTDWGSRDSGDLLCSFFNLKCYDLYFLEKI